MKSFRGNIESVFCYCRDLNTPRLEHFSKFDELGVWRCKGVRSKFNKIQIKPYLEFPLSGISAGYFH